MSLPLVMTVMDGERYLVSMLGEDANWVRNVKAAGGRARLRHGVTEQVLLEEVDVEKEGADPEGVFAACPRRTPDIPVDKDAPLAEFEKIAPGYPVFRVKKAT